MGGRTFSNHYFAEVRLGAGGGFIDLTPAIKSLTVSQEDKKFTECTIEIANPDMILTEDDELELMWYHNLRVEAIWGYKQGPVRALIGTTVSSRFLFPQDGVPIIEITTHSRGHRGKGSRKEKKDVHLKKTVLAIMGELAAEDGWKLNTSRADGDKLSIFIEEMAQDGETNLEFMARLCSMVNHRIWVSDKDNTTVYIIRQYENGSGIDHTWGYGRELNNSDNAILNFDCNITSLVPVRLEGNIIDIKKGTRSPQDIKADTNNITAYKGRSIQGGPWEVALIHQGNGGLLGDAVRDEFRAAFHPDDNWPNWSEPRMDKAKDLADMHIKMRLEKAIEADCKVIGDTEVLLYDFVKIKGLNTVFSDGVWEIVGVRHSVNDSGYLTECKIKRPGLSAREVGGHNQAIIKKSRLNRTKFNPPTHVSAGASPTTTNGATNR